MKTQIFVVSCFLGGIVSLAQGTVVFANWYPVPADKRVDAPFFDKQGAPLTGPAYVAQLYAGQTADSLTPVASPISFGPNQFVPAGYFYGGLVVVPTITGYGGGPAWVQVRAWAVAGGATYEQAAATGAYTGLSNVLFLSYTGDPALGGGPTVPVHLVGLQFLGIPEPAPWLLGLLGFGILALRPRRRGQGAAQLRLSAAVHSNGRRGSVCPPRPRRLSFAPEPGSQEDGG